MSTTKTLTCAEGEGTDSEHTFEFEQKGRGRPPRLCPTHKALKTAKKSPSDNQTISDGMARIVPNAETNPFIRKAKAANPFVAKAAATIEKLAEDLEASTGTAAEDESELAKHQTALLEHSEKRRQRRANRPAHFEPVDHGEEIADTRTYNDAALPGIKICDIHRDVNGQWSCTVEINEEKFELIRRGGWLIKRPDGKGFREALPQVAAAIQARVVRLEHKPEEDGPKKRQKPAKTLEQVADEVVPVKKDEPPTEVIQEAPELKTCECCERNQEPGEKGWKVIEEIQFCPTCAAALSEDDEFEDEDSESDVGYTDLLAKPEQFDGAYADFADTIESELG